MTAAEPSHDAAPEPRDVRFNFAMLVGDVSTFFIGLAFLDSSTAMPALVERLGGGPQLLGLLGALRQGAYFLPPLIVAHLLHGRARHKPFLIAVTAVGRLGYMLAALAVLAFGRTRPEVALGALVLAYGISWLCDGAGGVPWTAMVGRMIPDRVRGRLFATTKVVSAVSGIGVGALVTLLLSGRVPSPLAEALLVGGCFTGMAVSWCFLAALREPPVAGHEDEETAGPRQPFGAYLRGLPARFRSRPDMAWLALTQILGAASVAGSPFLLAFAEASAPGRLPPGMAGRFLIAQTLGGLCFAPVWGGLTDRYGPRLAMTALFAGSLLWPTLAAAGHLAGNGSLLPFYAAYFALGAVLDSWVVITNYMLEAVRPAEQPVWTGLLNTSSIPALVLPFTAGLLAARLGPGAALTLSATLLLAGLATAAALPDTRRKN